MSFILSDCKYDFSSDNINIICLVYDCSGSMNRHTHAIIQANNDFYMDFSKFEEKGSVAICKVMFNDSIIHTSFNDVKHFSTDYYAECGTALYTAIVEASDNTIKYYNEIVKRLNVRPRITLFVLSDGRDNSSDCSVNDAKKAITRLNSLDATTVFVAFNEAIRYKDGEQLGFTCTRDITSARELISCLGNELSKSCQEQSKSAYSLKSAFFSKAKQNDEEDSVEEIPITDDDFFGNL